MYSKLDDVCDVKTFETLCFAKVLFGENLFIPKRYLRENFKILLIINNSSPLFYFPSFWANPKSHLAVYILIKGRKTHEILLVTLKKTPQTLNVARYSEKARGLKVANFRKHCCWKNATKIFPCIFLPLMQVNKGTYGFGFQDK